MRKCISICFYEDENDDDEFVEEVELSGEDLKKIINELSPLFMKLITELSTIAEKKEESENVRKT